MNQQVHVIGAARSDFKRNLRKEGKSIRDLIVEAGADAIRDAGIEPAAVEAGVVGNFAAGLYTHQLHLGALLIDIDDALCGIPTLHTEAACASGSVAVLTAAHWIRCGLHDVVLVVGAEQQKTMSPADGSEVLAAAGDWIGEKPRYGAHMMPKLFASIASRYRDCHGLNEDTLATVVMKNYSHASLNDLAQMRDAAMTLDRARTVCDSNPCFAPPLKTSDCSQITDGAAAVVLASDRVAGQRGMRLLGFGHTTDRLDLDRKQVPEFPQAARAGALAFSMAGIGPREIDLAEVHDCFSIAELLMYARMSHAVQNLTISFQHLPAPSRTQPPCKILQSTNASSCSHAVT